MKVPKINVIVRCLFYEFHSNIIAPFCFIYYWWTICKIILIYSELGELETKNLTVDLAATMGSF